MGKSENLVCIKIGIIDSESVIKARKVQKGIDER